MFKSILIANRGEIACRIISTCRRLGIESIAVYSEADRGARHVRLADRAVLIGPAPASESYLRIDRIVSAAREFGADAVHPGYGFLAENAEFARELEAAGVVLIGPRPETIELMGSKARAKQIMERAGVPQVPGYHGDEQDDPALKARAREIGYPLMLKAAAGGGGKGMRIVRSEAEFEEALAAARREALSAFGDQRMILERYLASPRHIEAQVFADRHGHCVHLYERDCSTQRRHQKVIEEAPAPGLAPELRERLLEAAVQAARAVDYLGAGTVEFLVEGDAFYFLEMNTRLQVEHPVTEAITGFDLVEWQIRVAAGQPLPVEQEQIRFNGHAIEARIYAEDPARGFLPGSGRISGLQWPEDAAVRIDTGVEAGDQVSIHYDPMIAKLIVHGPDRQVALATLRRALGQAHVAGLGTNLDFLLALAHSEELALGHIDTGLLDRELDRILDRGRAPPDAVWVAAALVRLARLQAQDDAPASPWDVPDGWRPGHAEACSWLLECNGHRAEVGTVGPVTDCRTVLHGQPLSAALHTTGPGVACLELDGRTHRIAWHSEARHVEVVFGGRRWRVLDHAAYEPDSTVGAASGRVIAPMPGKVIKVLVTEGQTIEVGQPLLLLEAMKMELTLRAEMAGTVQSIGASPGELVEADALLVEIG